MGVGLAIFDDMPRCQFACPMKLLTFHMCLYIGIERVKRIKTFHDEIYLYISIWDMNTERLREETTDTEAYIIYPIRTVVIQFAIVSYYYKIERHPKTNKTHVYSTQWAYEKMSK